MRPEALNWSIDNCTIGRAMQILGERWTVVVLREIFTGVRRFDDMRERTGIPRQVLSNRLAGLVAHGILRREPYREPGARVRHEYRLTDKGFDLYPVLVAVGDWGERYLADPSGPPLRIVHADCEAQVHAVLRCEAGHDIATMRQVQPRPGPGAVRRSLDPPRRPDQKVTRSSSEGLDDRPRRRRRSTAAAPSRAARPGRPVTGTGPAR